MRDLATAVVAGAGAVVLAVTARRAPGRAHAAGLVGHAALAAVPIAGGPAGRRRALDPIRRAVGRSLERADLQLTVGQAVAAWASAVVLAALLAGSLAPPAPAIAVSATAVGLPAWVVRRARAAGARLADEVPTVLEHVAGELRAGSSVPLALTHADRCGPAAARLTVAARHRLAVGAGLAEALAAWRRDTAAPDDHLAGAVRVAAAGLAVVERTGGPGADALDAIARGLRDRAEVADEVRALATQARASAQLVTAAPLAHLGLAGASGSGGVAELVGTRAGQTCLVVGLVLLTVAHRWMRRIVEQAA